MKILIHGGTHLGIVGFYGEKTFEVKSPNDLRQAIIDDPSLAKYNLAEADEGGYLSTNGHPIHTFEEKADKAMFEPDRGKTTVFEYRIVELEF